MVTRLFDEGDRDIMGRMRSMLQEVITVWHGSSNHAAAASSAAGIVFVRMAGSWRSICKLLDDCSDLHEMEVFSNDAAAILRCLHDASLQAEYILDGDGSRGQSPDDLGTLYLDFEIVERHEMMQKGLTFTSTFARRLAASPLRPKGEAKLQQAFDRIKGAYQQPDGRTRAHWYKGNLPQIAEKLGRKEEHFWLLRSYDSSIHAGPSAALKGPMPAGADLVTVANYLICRTAKRLASAAGIVLSAESAELIEAYPDNMLNVDPGSSDEGEATDHDDTR